MRLAGTSPWVVAALALFAFSGPATASYGDKLADFRECVEACIEKNCGEGGPSIPIHRRLLRWTCPSECDYVCQHIITDARLAHDPPYVHVPAVVQFHGKWPFYRFLGMQEPFSVLFSLLNYLAHVWGMAQLRESISPSYPFRKYYLMLGYVGCASWLFSMVFHTRDTLLTERLDYFAAGAQVLYGLYLAVLRVFRLDKRDPPYRPSLRRAWTGFCCFLYILHVGTLTYSWSYTRNMAANVVVGALQNLVWIAFSYTQFREKGMKYSVLPGLLAACVTAVMSLELLDFAPIGRMLDAHSLWHLATAPLAVAWYQFLLKDAGEEARGSRLKQ